MNEELTTVNQENRHRVEELGQLSNDLANLLAATDIATVFLDHELRIVRFTPRVGELFNVRHTDRGRPLGDLTHRLGYPELLDDARRVLERLVPVEREVRSEAGGWFLARLLPYRVENRIEGVVITLIDVTDRRRTEQALRASEERLRLALEAARMGTWSWDVPADRHRRDANLNRLLGLEPAESVLPIAEFFTHLHPDDRAAVEAAFDSSVRQGRNLDVEFRVVRPDGAVRWLRDQGDVFRSLAGDVATMAGACLDVTDRREAEEALRESESRLAAIFERAAVGLSEVSPDGRFLRVNEALCGMLGLPCESLTSLGVADVTHPDDLPAVRAAIGRLTGSGLPETVEKRCVRPDGGVLFTASGLTRLDDPDGRPRTILAVTADLSDRRRAEAALRESEERLRGIVESATDFAILTLDDRRRVTSWSTGAEAVFGYAADEIFGRPADELFTPEDRAAGAPEAEARTAVETGRAADERWHLRKDGSRFYAAGVMTPLRVGGAGGFVKIARDLTDRKRMEDELRQARDALEARVAERTAELTRANEARLDLLRRLSSAQEDERLRLSRELHDQTGQHVAGLILGLKAAEDALAGGEAGPAASARLRPLRGIVETIGREVHDLALELRPTALDDLGLAVALRNYVESWSERTGIAADFHSADGDRLPAEAETALYRVVQEALTNVLRHAAAKRVGVLLERRDGTTVVIVEDDGAGFDADDVFVVAQARGRIGLLGMRERLAAVGGSLDVESAPGAGTTVFARVPAPALPDRP